MKRLLSIVVILLQCLNLLAQEMPPCPKVSEMHQRKFGFLVAKAQISQRDAELIKPYFLEYEKSLWELHKKNRSFFKAAMGKMGDEKPNYAVLNEMYINQEVRQSVLLKKYHLQIRKLISPETLFRYYQAEREFKHHLMDDMRGRPPKGDRP